MNTKALAAGGAALRPAELRCEHRDNPLGIRETRPRLTWRIEAPRPDARGIVQGAYQILVASSPEKLAADEGDLWDSGKVASNDVRAVYSGKKLASLQQAFWKMRLWDGEDRPSGWSEPALWSRGLEEMYAMRDWPGQWIGHDATDARRPDDLTDAQRTRARTRELKWIRADDGVGKKRPHPAFDIKHGAPLRDSQMAADGPLTAFFRKTFQLDPAADARARITSATIWLVPDMVCEIWVNGRRAGTVARWEIARQVDIAPYLRNGENVIGLRVTQEDGYTPAACGEAELFFAGGESMRIPLDAECVFAPTAGESWSAPGHDTGAWKKVAVQNAPPWGTWEYVTERFLPPAHLRKEFTVSKKIRRATLCATAAGVYEIELNGSRVGSDYFSPGWTDYSRRIHAQTYDVTEMVSQGKNAIGVLLGDGWFSGCLGYSGKKWNYGGYPRARVMLVLEHEDGKISRVVSDASWKASAGPLRYADMLQGCGYDARLEMPGWSRAGFDDSKWARASTGMRPILDGGVTPVAHNIVEGAMLDGVRVTEELKPASVREISPGVWIVDFGQNLTGWVRLKTSGDAGRRVLLRHAEMLNPNGTIYTTNLRGASAANEFWLKGGGEETLEPKLTFHGFRYVEVRGLQRAPAPGDFTALVAHSPMKRTGWFESSNATLNRLFENIIWGQRGNYLEIPTDCPQRDERLGWTGDTQFFARTASYNFDVRAFLERWLVTHIEDSQAADGSFAPVSPMVPAGRSNNISTAWGDAALLCTHTLWKHYGETRGIEQHFDAMARYIDFLERRARDGIVFVGGYGDWLHKGGTAKTEVMDTAYYAHLCDLMSEMARAIGRIPDAERFARQRDEVKAAFARAFLGGDGSILESSQTGYALAFTMDLVPEHLHEKAAGQFLESIRKFDWHLATGFIGTPRLLPALFNAGLDGAAWRVLMQDTYPSWLYQVKLGATTMWERWDGWTPEAGFQAITMNSFNHYAFGAVGEALYRHVAGIDTEGPGFLNIVIRPRIGKELTFARAAYEAPTGRIESGWKREAGGRLTLDVRIPAGSRARIHIPARSVSAVTEGGRALGGAPGVRVLASEGGPAEVVCETGSGIYHFEISQ